MEYATKKRNEQILEMRKEGKTYTQLANEFGLSRERIRQIVIKTETYGKHTHQEWYDAIIKACHNLGYSETAATRTYKCLLRSRLLVKMKNENLTLDDYSDYELMQIRNFGVRSLQLAREANYLLTGKRTDNHKVFKFQKYHDAFLKASKQLGYCSNSANRAYKTLLGAGIFKNIDDNNKSLNDFSNEYLMQITGFGEKSLEIVRTAEEMV